jgi:hypothetical protein
MKKPNLTDRFLNEVILYGGIPMTRANVYRQCLKDTGSKKAADMFAFSHSVKRAPAGSIPFTLAQFRKATSVRRTIKRNK